MYALTTRIQPTTLAERRKVRLRVSAVNLKLNQNISVPPQPNQLDSVRLAIA